MAHHGASVLAQPSPSTAAARRDEIVVFVGSAAGQRHCARLPSSDIQASVQFSYWRCIVSIIGFALVLTDIPRTGLSLNLDTLYKSAAPGVYWSYGPFAYTSIHINRSANGSAAFAYTGTRKDVPTTAANVWAYKFDTLSIAQRAIAGHLPLRSYPDCILYQHPCPAPTLSLQTAFRMIDSWISSMESTYFAPGTTDRTLPFVFLTRSNWLDRLHHIVLKPAWKRQDTRLHTVRFYPFESTNLTTHPWRLCGQKSLPRHRRVQRAYVCDLPVQWRFKHPLPPLPAPATPPMVSIPRHIELRFAALQRRYPDLQLDLTVVTTRSIITSEPYTSKLPIVFYTMENVEITTWIRGSRCTSRSPHCETVFVDDYRYEGATLTSNNDDWRMVTSGLRAAAQGYIWLRFLCLCWGAFCARSDELRYRSRPLTVRIFATLATLSRIPSHVVVYGSWLPVACYSAAHVMDSGLTHLISNNVWASTDGLFNFQLVSYVQSASVQMRNVWMIAFVWKLLLFAQTHGKSRGAAWAPRNGIVAMRGIFISFISWVTVFSFLRALRFRDTDIAGFTPLARHVPTNGLRFPPNYANIADFGYRLDVKTTITTTMVVVLCGQLMQRLVSLCTKRQTRYFFCHTYYIPHSAGRLWPRAMLHLYWNLGLNEPTKRAKPTASVALSQSRQGPLPSTLLVISSQVLESALMPPTPKAHLRCSVCNRAQSLVHWRSVQGCVYHDHLFRVERRGPEVWAMVRLANLAFLSDPLTLLGVYLFGFELYLYSKANAADSQGPLEADTVRTGYLLPAPLEEIGESSSSGRLRLLTSVNSKTLPWGVLVHCG